MSQDAHTKRAIRFLKKMMEYIRNSDFHTLLEEIQNTAKEKDELSDPFRILISTVLSVRNRDESTHIATVNLFDHGGLNTPEKLRDASVEKIEEYIRKSGMYKTKAKRIQEISRILLEKHNGKVPREMIDLLALPGVGRKVANCVRVFAFNIPAIPVDTHVHRLSNRMGLVETKNPEDTEKILTQIYPEQYWSDVNNTFVSFGRHICKPIGPLCDFCPLNEECPKILQKKSPNKSSIRKNNSR